MCFVWRFVSLCNKSGNLSDLADKSNMPYSLFLLITICIILHTPFVQAEYVGLYTGLSKIQQQYLNDDADSQEQTHGIQLNTQDYRRHPVGWYARGLYARIQQSPEHSDIDIHLPIYQFHAHQGIWFQFEWQKSTLETQLSSRQIYINESGNVQSIAAGSTLVLERRLQRGQIYWYESVKDEGPVNTLGVFYSVETSPVNSTLSSTNAELFDGRFSGFGFSLGRIKDDHGLNFQWRLNLAQLDTDFSNDATKHRSLSTQESTVYQVSLNLSWHYRYYLSPYWYLVPSAHFQYDALLQSEFKPEFVEHERFNFTQLSGFIALRRYF